MNASEQGTLHVCPALFSSEGAMSFPLHTSPSTRELGPLDPVMLRIFSEEFYEPG